MFAFSNSCVFHFLKKIRKRYTVQHMHSFEKKTKSQNYRITKCLRLEGTSWVHLVQLACSNRVM